MSLKTAIQWCDSTVNPTMGCDGCELWSEGRATCYAGSLHRRFGGKTRGYAPKFDVVTNFPGRMAEAAGWSDLTGSDRPNKPWLNGSPRLIFVSDMSDALSKSVPFDYLRSEIIDNVKSELGRRHQWLWLTKRPGRMAEFCVWLRDQGQSWPANLWAGTSITTQMTTSRIGELLRVGDLQTVHFLSVEPQVEPITIGEWRSGLAWVIQGGESGAQARPFDLEWAEALQVECRSHKISYFLKQLGSRVVRGGERVDFEDHHGGDWSQWPKKLCVRQFPSLSPTYSPTACTL